MCSKRVPSRVGLSTPFQLSDMKQQQKIVYANVYPNTINDSDAQTSLLLIFSEGGGTSVHWVSIKITVLICLVKKIYDEAIRGVYYLRIRRKTLC